MNRFTDQARRCKRELARRLQRLVHSPPQVNFVIIGAEKAGTTLLQEVLRAAPSVSMPENEVRYFRDPFFHDSHVLGDAIRHFSDEQLVGIKHPSYLGAEHVAERLHTYNAEMRLVVSLRDPVDRAISSYYHYLARGQISLRKPNDAFARILSNDQQGDPKYDDIFSFGCYHRHLERYFQVFPPSQILILEYERLARDRDSWNRLFSFLQIPDPPPEHIPECNVGSYDWKRCVRRHFFHKLTCVHDESMNLISFRPDEPITPDAAGRVFDSVLTQLESDSGPTSVSEATTAALVEAYRPEVEKLVSAGWLTPQHWRHFPLN